MNKQKLQEQIDTMREELAKMETELAECEKVELEEPKYIIKGDGFVCEHKSGFTQYHRFGASRATKELAEIASKNMVTRNKLEAYAHQIDPEWRAEWNNGSKYKYYIYEFNGGFHCGYVSVNNSIGTVYMSESTAEQICEWLNDGRIEL